MQQPLRISDTHTDMATPFTDRMMPEYTRSPERHASIGADGSLSVIQRASQLGITKDDIATCIQNQGKKSLVEISEDDYFHLLGKKAQQNYHLLVSNIYHRWETVWGKTNPQNKQEMFAYILDIAGRYKKWGFNLCLKSTDFNDALPNLILSLEGGDMITEVKDIDVLYELGIRSMVIQYYNVNRLVQDVGGKGRGLNDLGRKVVERMLELGIAIDLAHATPETRTDIFDISEALHKTHLVAYTHGARAQDYEYEDRFKGDGQRRGLRDDEVQRLLTGGGLMSLMVARPAVQSVEHLMRVLKDMIAKGYPSPLIAIGTDFGGVAPEWIIPGLSNPQEVASTLQAQMTKEGFKQKDIDNILRLNAVEYFKRVLQTQ